MVFEIKMMDKNGFTFNKKFADHLIISKE